MYIWGTKACVALLKGEMEQQVARMLSTCLRRFESCFYRKTYRYGKVVPMCRGRW